MLYTCLLWGSHVLEIYLILSFRPQEGDIEKSSIRLTWLYDNFNEEVLNSLGPNVLDDKVLWRHTRSYILRLLGMWLVSDKSTSLIHYKFLSLLENLHEVGEYSWDLAMPRRNLSEFMWCITPFCLRYWWLHVDTTVMGMALAPILANLMLRFPLNYRYNCLHLIIFFVIFYC